MEGNQAQVRELVLVNPYSAFPGFLHPLSERSDTAETLGQRPLL